LLVGKSLIIILIFQLWAIPIIVILYLILSIIDNYTTKKYEVQSWNWCDAARCVAWPTR
jgi:hypothetical protein